MLGLKLNHVCGRIKLIVEINSIVVSKNILSHGAGDDLRPRYKFYT